MYALTLDKIVFNGFELGAANQNTRSISPAQRPFGLPRKDTIFAP